MRTAVVCLVAVVGVVHADPLPKAPSDADEFILVRKGTLPIILTAPHGGHKVLPGVPVRDGHNAGMNKFVLGGDENTLEVALALHDALTKKLKGTPYLVAAKFQRKYLDVNRSVEEGCESDKAKLYHEYYHGSITSFCKEVKAHWGQGLLLDVHGQSAEAEGIYRGTQNGKTVTLLEERFGHKAVVGPDSVFGMMAARKYQILPANDSPDKETKYNGGYTVQAHGSHQASGIDAIQFELGFKLRSKDRQAKTVEDMTEALAKFSEKYLPTEPLPKK